MSARVCIHECVNACAMSTQLDKHGNAVVEDGTRLNLLSTKLSRQS